MKDWNDREIKVARSRRGVLVTSHPYENLITTGIVPWPAPEIVQKLYQSYHSRAFDDQSLAIATEGLGHYCDLQSIHSEDAITWSVFGTLAYSDAATRDAWVSRLLALCSVSSAQTTNSRVCLWRRLPHPDTLVPGGPEIDCTIITGDTVLLVEAKWLSGVGCKQGKNKDKDQIQLRSEFIERLGSRVFPQAKNLLVVLVSLSKEPGGGDLPTISWADVCELQGHPHGDELRRYLTWKEAHSKIGQRTCGAALG